MKDLQTHWTHAWAALQLQPPTGLYEQLLRSYAEPQRHYHTLQHLQECLALCSDVPGAVQHFGEVAVALWFHDAVYDVRGSDNEQRSADWAVQALQAAGAPASVQARVHALILATRHDALPAAGDAQLLVDIDLAILGVSPARFAEYAQQIRQEYAWVPEPVFLDKRQAILQSFLDRAQIYSTALFQARLEAQARRNLAEALAALAVG